MTTKKNAATANTFALLSSLRAVANPRQSYAAKEVAFTHLTAQFKAALPKEFASVAGSKISPDSSPNVDDLISALGVVADPAALPDNKARALDKLIAYFESLPSKGAQALSSAIKTLEARVASAEKIVNARATVRALAARAERPSPSAPDDPTIARIERAHRNAMGHGTSRGSGATVSAEQIERIGRQTVGVIRRP